MIEYMISKTDLWISDLQFDFKEWGVTRAWHNGIFLFWRIIIITKGGFL